MTAPGRTEAQAGGAELSRRILFPEPSCHPDSGAHSGQCVRGTSCRGAFSEARTEDRAPSAPTALAPLLFFPIVEEKHFLLLTALLREPAS